MKIKPLINKSEIPIGTFYRLLRAYKIKPKEATVEKLTNMAEQEIQRYYIRIAKFTRLLEELKK